MRYLVRLCHSKVFPGLLLVLLIFSWLFISSSHGSFSSLLKLSAFALNGNVTFLTQASPAEQSPGYPVSFLNDRARDITGASAVNAAGFVVPEGLTGEGQIVAVADSGLDIGKMDDIHPDLQSAPGRMPKVVLLKSWAGRDVPDDPSGHGTHMAATIAGTGAASGGQFRGVAPGAGIYFQAILNKDGEPEPPARLADLFWPAYSAGARVHVNGWGGGSNSYLSSAAQVDEFVRSHPDFLVIFGAGNSGPSSRTITAEANSKNALAVGASILPRPAFVPNENDTAATADFSSRGPAGDGRIKPELLAPASAVVSARSRLVEGNLPGYQDYTRMQGTSMAAAVAGGTTALLREYFKEHMYINVPSAALLKAALVNGSRPPAGGPDEEGFGIIDLAGTIIALKEGAFRLADEWAGVFQGEELIYTFHVAGSEAPFKATLAWTDPVAEPGSARALVNDLDLAVRAPDGRVYYGNHFLGANSPDRTNNVEQVYLPDPVPGEYTVRVSGAGVRRNTVRGSGTASQDFALVWGQPPAGGEIKSTDGRTVVLTDGSSFNPADLAVVNLVNENIAKTDAAHLFSGARVFRGTKSVYLAARLWRAAGVKAFKSSEDFVFTEINPAVRLGGYSLAGDGGGVTLNGSLTVPEKIPPGVEVSAVVNPVDQKIRQVRASYIEKEGVVLSVRRQNGQKILELAGGRGSYRILPSAVYSYEDTFKSAGLLDAPFGTGALEELAEVLPGMPVRLRLASSSSEVQYLAVKRWVLLGTVRGVDISSGEIRLEDGSSCRMFPGAPVKRDREDSSFKEIEPGDHVSAVLLPDTGEAIGLVAYSSVLYGRAIDFIKKDRTFYMLDDNGCYLSLCLSLDAVIYRWGVETTADAINAGCRVRVTTDPAGKTAWQLDIAETLYAEGVLENLDDSAGVLTVKEGGRYQVSGATRFYKNGCPVLPGDMLSGEKVELEYSPAPPPAGSVLVSVNARSAAPSPPLLASAVPLDGRLIVTGSTGKNAALYFWTGSSCNFIPVDGSGRFKLDLDPEEGYSFTLVAVERRTGGVTGRQVSPAGAGGKGSYGTAVVNAVSGAGISVSPSRAGPAHLAGVPLTRAQAAAALANLLNWPRSSEYSLPFTDDDNIPAQYRPAVAEAVARGVFKGYPDGSFFPGKCLSRAEAAVMLAAVMRHLGIDAGAAPALPYADAGDIPPWAAEAAARTMQAGLFGGRPDGRFAPDDLVAAGEMALLLDRLLAYLQGIFIR